MQEETAEKRLQTLAKLGVETRDKQKLYFYLRRKNDPKANDVLAACRKLEAEFDAACAAVLTPKVKPALLPFDSPPEVPS